jgi:hypothetical protein
MKKILYGIAACLLIFGTACTKIDNYDGPDARLSGKVIDKTTGEPFITGQGEMSIRMWETSWNTKPAPQDIVVKQDGTYDNTKLFSATYSILPYSGAFWPTTDTIKDFQLSGSKSLDFELTPYLRIIDVNAELVGSKLTLSCKLQAPVTENLPLVMEIRPFLSLTQYCGAGSRIDYYYKDSYRININKNWWDGVGDMTTGVSYATYTLPKLPLDRGKTYYVRIGAKVRDAFEQYNYSEVIKIVVPQGDGSDEIPDNFLENAEFPFSMASWDGNRWGTLTDWITNDAMRSRGNGQYGGYDGGYGEYQGGGCSSFGIERWNTDENPIVNGKIYQTFTLPAGQYEYTLSFAGSNPLRDNNGNDPRYIVVATGKTIPDIENISTAIASAPFAGVSRDGAVTVNFTIAAPTEVSAGVVTSFTSAQQNIRVSTLTLKKL